MQLPDYIIENPLLNIMKDAVNDFVAFSNVSGPPPALMHGQLLIFYMLPGHMVLQC